MSATAVLETVQTREQGWPRQLLSHVWTHRCRMQLPGDSHAIVAISCDGQSTILALGAKPRRAVAIFKELDCAPVGCIAKSLTARLMLEASADGVVTLDDLVGNALGRAEQSLQGVTVRSLLNHTHGLDGAGLTHVAREPSGMLDVDWLVKTVVRPRPLFSPGALYSYGSVGAWLSACILERLYGVTFETLLRERLLAPLHRDANDHRLAESKSICPAVGGVDLRLSTCILMKFLDWHQQFSTLRAKRIAASMTQATVPIRGWSRAVASGLGWKHFGGGWFGHSGIWNGVHTVLRFNTMFRCAVAVKSTGIPATSVLARLLGPALPEFYSVPAGDQTDIHQAIVEGVFQNRALRIRVRTAKAGTAHLFWRSTGSSITEATNVDQRSSLSPISKGLYAVRPPIPGWSPWFQFLKPQSTDPSFFIWNGRDVLPKVE